MDEMLEMHAPDSRKCHDVCNALVIVQVCLVGDRFLGDIYQYQCSHPCYHYQHHHIIIIIIIVIFSLFFIVIMVVIVSSSNFKH